MDAQNLNLLSVTIPHLLRLESLSLTSTKTRSIAF